jgi:putative ABC transport system permease protein
MHTTYTIEKRQYAKLQDDAYRIEISWWMFALTGIITIALTFITVGWKAIKAATENPVKVIKSE